MSDLPLLVGYRKFYTVFTLSLLTARYIYHMRLSYTAFVWAVWIFVWTSPPVLSWILSLCTRQATKEDHYSAIFQSHSKEHRPRGSPDVRKTVNDTPYYTAHFYTVCQAFAFVNVGGPLAAADSGTAGWVIKCVGWAVCLMGFAGALWSRHNLGSEWRGAPEVRDDHRLITTGPYGFTRHPIYSSLFLMMIGSALTTRYWLSLVEVCVVIVAYTIKAVAEERFLLQHFGVQYEKYQKSTYMLMPLIY